MDDDGVCELSPGLLYCPGTVQDHLEDAESAGMSGVCAFDHQTRRLIPADVPPGSAHRVMHFPIRGLHLSALVGCLLNSLFQGGITRGPTRNSGHGSMRTGNAWTTSISCGGLRGSSARGVRAARDGDWPTPAGNAVGAIARYPSPPARSSTGPVPR